jgi:predicted unusual protein kinase regulating ubiquinone biosynthesis (AarF/ABC1/UbiB family)
LSPDDRLDTSASRRLLRLGRLVGRVGGSLLVHRALEIPRSGVGREARRAEALVRNATRIAETLGEMKGAAMKVGQMLSLHEGLLPPEVTAVLRSLQQQAPPIPFEVVEEELDVQLPDYGGLFASLEPAAFAAASIGQVHRGVLRDGRAVAVKIQYPEIERVVRADLGNLRRLLGSLFALVSDVDFEPVWNELRDRLVEELDYTREAANLRELRDLWAAEPAIVVPGVVPEATTRSVLTMEYVAGIGPDEACSDQQPAALRDQWGRHLLEFALRGLFVHRVLHADPNLANFAFLPDGRVVVYDLGCVKRVPESLARGYAQLVLAVAEDRPEDVPPLLQAMGVAREDGSPVPRTMTDPYAELFATLVRTDPPYTFGADEALYPRLVELGLRNLPEAADVRFPQDVVFVNRTLAGHLGNLNRLRATAPWRDIILGPVAAAA